MNGVVPVDKPAGPTSHDVVAAARRALGLRRIGHTGTLDPFATGLLLLCLGPATRLSEYLTGLPKRYEANARLGVRTDTLDSTGAVLARNDAWRALAPESIGEAFEAERGTHLQQPPAYSAKKVGGRRAHELAREGEAVHPDPVEVTVHSLEVLEVDGPLVRFTLECSSGTYVRAVARDAGERLGVGAHLTQLRRTAIGTFRVEDALQTDRLDDRVAATSALISPLEALRHLPAATLDADAARRVRTGQAVPWPGRGPAGPGGGLVALASGGELVAVAERDGDLLRPRKVFA
ncbi:MAG TPA: tRNA pseudouridine(55) synthase TruB [Longimicrobiales bacterium]|nr:tRNA pseudouridine(55) synthase TruB [Longimicrobiales bacterium]